MITSVFTAGNKDISEACDIRREVFVDEQGISEAEEFDSLDEIALHLMVYVDEEPAATGRICHDQDGFHIGRIAVRKKFRGQKIGDLTVRLLLYKAFNSGAETLKISAQTYVVPFYKKFGFKECGDEYTEAGLPHVPMEVTKDTVVYPSACHKE